MKLESIKPANDGKHKYTAVFSDPKRTTQFGQAGADDFIKTRDEQKKAAYLARHKARENWNDPTSAGALSKFLLWSEPTFKLALAKYKKHFNL